jgi:hypothetical protein
MPKRRRRLGAGLSTEETILRIVSAAPMLREPVEIEIAARFRLTIRPDSSRITASYASYLKGDEGVEQIDIVPAPSQLVRATVVALRRRSAELAQARRNGERDELRGQLQMPFGDEGVDHAEA